MSVAWRVWSTREGECYDSARTIHAPTAQHAALLSMNGESFRIAYVQDVGKTRPVFKFKITCEVVR